MVAVTVLLAAVVGVFAMNMDMPENQPPSTSWDISAGSNAIVIEHDGGESAEAVELVAVVNYGGTEKRYGFVGTSAYNDGDDLIASDSLEIDFSGSSSAPHSVDANSYSLSSVEEVQLIWESTTSSQTQPLTSWDP